MKGDILTMIESIAGSILITKDIEAIFREVEACRRQIQQTMQMAADFKKNLDAMAESSARMRADIERAVAVFRLPDLFDPIRWP
jgi:hypothetical protein